MAHPAKKKRDLRKSPVFRPAYAVWQANLDKNVALRLLDRGLVQIQTGQLLEFMKELLATEQGAVELYEFARDCSENSDLKSALLDYRQQSEHHADLIEAMVRDLGGNPSLSSPSAQVHLQRTRFMLTIAVPSDCQEIANLDSLLTVLTKVHSNWAFLRAVIPHLDDPHARELGEQLLLEVGDQEEEQLDWVRQALGRSLMKRALPRV